MALTNTTITVHIRVQPSKVALYSDRTGSHYLYSLGNSHMWLIAYKYAELLIGPGLPAVPTLVSTAGPCKQFDLWI